MGDSLTKKIGQGIEDSHLLGVVLSHNSVNSEWVQKELQIALQKEISEKRVVVLPILIEKVVIPPFLRDKKYADFTDPEKFDKTFQDLRRFPRAERSRKNDDAQDIHRYDYGFERIRSDKRSLRSLQ